MLKFLLTFLTISILGIYYIHPLPLQVPNPDIGTHLLLGKIILSTGSVPDTNLLSFSNSNFHYVNTTWLSEVIFYVIYNFVGFNGLILFAFFIMLSTFLINILFVAKKYNHQIICVVTILYLQLLVFRTEVRPELFSYLFLSVFIVILYTYRKAYTKWIYLLIPIQLLWVNTHIYFIIGDILMLLFLLDTFLENKKQFLSKKNSNLLIATIGVLFITLCNPNYFTGALYPFFVFNNYGANVIENKDLITAFFQYFDVPFVYYVFTLLAILSGTVLSLTKLKRFDIWVLLLFTALGLFAVRNVGLFIFGTYIVAIKIFSKSTIKSILPSNAITIIRDNTIMLWFLLVLLIMPNLYWHLLQSNIGLGSVDTMQNAMNFFTKNNLKGPIYNNYDIGSYLTYKLYPKEKVFVDGRPEAYPKDFFYNEYIPMQLSIQAFEQIDKKYHFTVIIYQHENQTDNTNQLLYDLVHSNTWKMIYLDSRSVIFVKNIPSNKTLIAHYVITQNTALKNKNDLQDKNDLAYYSNFFRVVGWYDRLTDIDLQYLTLEPNNCTILNQIVFVMNKEQNPLTYIYQNKYNEVCQNTNN